ncbi:hypothetical protein [Demequina sp.]|uniref:hypothetical protein n=1 Tax=Demequina sp. TaxID=2050685 RepID=UPI003A8B9D47
MARRRRPSGGIAALAIIVAVGGAAVVWGPGLWERYAPAPVASSQCTVTLGDRSDTKTAEQAGNIALIVAGSMRWGLPARAGTIGVATAIQESSLRNIDYGDRDSVGLFQQRPSQGWGTFEQIMDPYYSTDKFYEGLVKVDGWQDMEVTDAAQAVQRSGFPLAYADHEEEGRLWASALTGHGGTVTCDLADASLANARDFIARVDADFGEGAFALSVADVGADTTTLLAAHTAGDTTREAAIREWAVAVAAAEGVVVASRGDEQWARTGDVPSPSAGPTDATLITLRTAD